MKFICTVIINQPKEKVAAYFENPEYLSKYQEGFLRKELISGDSMKDNAISKLYYKMGNGGEMELTETVLKNDLPNSFIAQYHHKHTDNTMESNFTALNENQTQYDAEINYTAFKGVMVKIMALLFPSIFKKQVQKWLNNFKVFLEKPEHK